MGYEFEQKVAWWPVHSTASLYVIEKIVFELVG